MADFYLVGNLDDDDDLWLISKADQKAYPIPRAIWEDVVSLFPVGDLSPDPSDQEPRKDHAASVIAAAESRFTVTKAVSIALSANELGKMFVTMRSAPIEEAVSSEEGLSEVLRRFVSLGRTG